MSSPRVRAVLTGVSLLGAVALVGCDGGDSERSAAIERGVATLTGVSRELGTELGRGAPASVSGFGERLEEAWSAFEDPVKDAYPDSYEEIEAQLDPLIAGTRAEKPDPRILGELNDRLMKALAALGSKVESR